MQAGGNIVRTFSSDSSERIFAEGERYGYKYRQLSAGQKYTPSAFESLTIYLLSGKLTVGNSTLFNEGDVLQVEGQLHMTIQADADARFFVAWTSVRAAEKKAQVVRPLSEIKKVSKPWGYEIWLTGEHPAYCFKKIFIRQGTKTSLQYHNFKKETNFLYEGEARLYFKTNDTVNDLVTEKDISFVLLSAPTSIDVEPGTIHRLEAVSDITLYEVSTPEVDDVVRLQDDAKRPHGRISTEHS